MDETEQEAVEFFSPYSDKFLTCQSLVNKRFANLIAEESKARIEPRSYSSCLNDLMINALREAFVDSLEVQPLRRYAQTTFLFGGQYRMKAKKFDDRFRLSFIPTKAALDFLDFNIQLAFSGMPAEPLSIVLCYRLNPVHTEIQDVYLAWPDGKKNFLWLHKIEPALGVKSERE